MHGLFAMIPVLADAAQAAGADGEDPSNFSMLPFFVIIGVLFYLMVILPQRKKEKNFRSLVENLKKNDKVVTIGGIHGVITNVQRDIDRVTLRIDETTGATIRVGSGAISRVVTDDNESDNGRTKKA